MAKLGAKTLISPDIKDLNVDNKMSAMFEWIVFILEELNRRQWELNAEIGVGGSCSPAFRATVISDASGNGSYNCLITEWGSSRTVEESATVQNLGESVGHILPADRIMMCFNVGSGTYLGYDIVSAGVVGSC